MYLNSLKLRLTRLLAAGLLALFPAAGPEPVFAAGDLESDFKILIGNWRRIDGGYVLDIRSIDSEGRMDAGYFNPRSVHVSRAEASRAKSKIGVTVELRDIGYPGSTYTLVYSPEKDALFGYYFHAASGQYFDVLFIRMK
jgi:hypothetical protein